MAVVVKTFFVQAFYIPSESMEPTMLVNDKILVQKVSYWAGDVKRGDVVVFADPGGWLGEGDHRTAKNAFQKGLEKIGLFPTGGHLIKRVVGVGGDNVKCCNNDKLVVNGVELDEPYLKDPKATKDRTFEVNVKPGYIWVMGDNRNNSSDSRSHQGSPGGGQVSVDEVVGKAWVRVWPLDRIGFIHKPKVFETIKDK